MLSFASMVGCRAVVPGVVADARCIAQWQSAKSSRSRSGSLSGSRCQCNKGCEGSGETERDTACTGMFSLNSAGITERPTKPLAPKTSTCVIAVVVVVSGRSPHNGIRCHSNRLFVVLPKPWPRGQCADCIPDASSDVMLMKTVPEFLREIQYGRL